MTQEQTLKRIDELHEIEQKYIQLQKENTDLKTKVNELEHTNANYELEKEQLEEYTDTLTGSPNTIDELIEYITEVNSSYTELKSIYDKIANN